MLTKLEHESVIFIKVHCATHKVSLAAKDSIASIEIFKGIDALLKDIYNFYSNSASRLGSLR